jgi:serine/threonine protein phosphatase PrpC/CRP-like cAMP-binding protein
MKVAHSALSDQGLVRKNNEDSFLCDDQLQLYIVADGMGGHAGGEVASAMACAEVKEAVLRNREVLDEYLAGQGETTDRDIRMLLSVAVQRASTTIREKGEAQPELRGMGTTIEVALFIKSRAFVAHVGDSRVYLIRNGEMHQITRDHSLANQLKDLGRIQNEDEIKPRFRNAVTRALGFYESVEVDVLDMDLFPGDRFILCSDGLHGFVSQEEIQRCAAKSERDLAVQHLVRQANSKGGKDNITAVIVEVADIPEEHGRRVAERLEVLRNLVLFRRLDYEELLRINNVIKEVAFADGTSIFAEGQGGEEMFVILAGAVAIRRGEVEIARLGKGTHFGEMAMVDRQERSADAVALEDTICLSLARKDFYELVQNHSITGVKLLWNLSRVLALRLRTTTAELQGLKNAFKKSIEEEMADPSADPFEDTYTDSAF